MDSASEKNADKCLEAQEEWDSSEKGRTTDKFFPFIEDRFRTKSIEINFATSQAEEVEVLCSIYGEEWKTEDEAERSYSIEIKQDTFSVTFYVTLPITYPLESPPTYTIFAPHMSGEQKNQLCTQLEEVYSQYIGQTVLFQWIEKIKDYLKSLNLDSDCIFQKCTAESAKEEEKHVHSDNAPNIIHGEIIVDRKSVFQGHVSFVFSINDVREVLNELKKNRKIANATHNIYAYRINLSENSVIQDCDDDGESKAGSRLLHLLQVLDVRNVVVIVSRWYGGHNLGADRFRHINNAAREVLEQSGIIKKK